MRKLVNVAVGSKAVLTAAQGDLPIYPKQRTTAACRFGATSGLMQRQRSHAF